MYFTTTQAMVCWAHKTYSIRAHYFAARSTTVRSITTRSITAHFFFTDSCFTACSITTRSITARDIRARSNRANSITTRSINSHSITSRLLLKLLSITTSVVNTLKCITQFFVFFEPLIRLAVFPVILYSLQWIFFTVRLRNNVIVIRCDTDGWKYKSTDSH